MKLFTKIVLTVVALASAGAVQAGMSDQIPGRTTLVQSASDPNVGTDGSGTPQLAALATVATTDSLPRAALAFNRANGKAPALDLAGPAPAPPSGAGDSPMGTQFLFATTDLPEPAGWTTLLCALVIVAFLVKRKRDSFSD